MTLDHLSGGRIVLPVGLGALDDPGFGGVGEPTDRRIRAELLDESLEILTRAWSGAPFTYEALPDGGDGLPSAFGAAAAHSDLGGCHLAPVKSVDRAPPLRRHHAVSRRPDGGRRGDLTTSGRWWPRRAQGRALTSSSKERPRPMTRKPRGSVLPLAEAGATWWIESPWEAPSVADLRQRIAAGPPR